MMFYAFGKHPYCVMELVSLDEFRFPVKYDILKKLNEIKFLLSKMVSEILEELLITRKTMF